jgi:hypothetical protein
MDFIGNCAHEGPAALVKLWSEVGNDSARAEAVVDAASRVRDQRLADAATAIAKDVRKSDAVRLAAIILLVRYADPHTGLAVSLLTPPISWQPGQNVRMIQGGRSPHAIPQVTGDVPLSSTFANDVVATLRTLGEGDPSRRVQYVAAGLVARLNWDVSHGYLD